MSLSSLPDDVLARIMRCLPLKHRPICSLVNSRLRAAAIAATDTVVLLPAGWEDSDALFDWSSLSSDQDRLVSTSREHAAPIQIWLSKYGQNVRQLFILRLPQPIARLPHRHLRRLTLEKCSVQLRDLFGFGCLLDDCKHLTCLDLADCNIIGASQGAVLDLSSLVSLKMLQIQPAKADGEEYLLGGLSAATLPALTRLATLRFDSLSTGNLQQLSGLTALANFQLNANSDAAVGPSSVPGLALPPSLTCLGTLSPVEAAILASVPNLQDLWMR